MVDTLDNPDSGVTHVVVTRSSSDRIRELKDTRREKFGQGRLFKIIDCDFVHKAIEGATGAGSDEADFEL